MSERCAHTLSVQFLQLRVEIIAGCLLALHVHISVLGVATARVLTDAGEHRYVVLRRGSERRRQRRLNINDGNDGGERNQRR